MTDDPSTFSEPFEYQPPLIRKILKKHGMFIGGIIGGLIATCIGKGLNPDLRVFGIFVGYGTGGFLGELISSKITSPERR